MYKITLIFKSNEKDVYTQETEIATDEYYLFKKVYRMVKRWSDILIPHISLTKVNGTYENVSNNLITGLPPVCLNDQYYWQDINLSLMMIENHIELLNKCKKPDDALRDFQIIIEKLDG